MKSRLPLLLALLGGVFVWRGGFGLFPVSRSIVWRLDGEFATIRQVDLQLYDGDQLLKREQLTFPNGATFEPTSSLSLRKGSYRALVMVWRGDGGPEVRDRRVEVDEGSPTVVVP